MINSGVPLFPPGTIPNVQPSLKLPTSAVLTLKLDSLDHISMFWKYVLVKNISLSYRNI